MIKKIFTEGLTEMAEGYRIWLDRISTSYGT